MIDYDLKYFIKKRFLWIVREKLRGKNSKLKEKTQGLGDTRLYPLPKWCNKKSLR